MTANQNSPGILGGIKLPAMDDGLQVGILSAIPTPPTTPMFVALSGAQAMGIPIEQLQKIADPRNGHPSQSIAGAELARRIAAGKGAGQPIPVDAATVARRLAFAKGQRFPK